ncbi:hypothetical protein G7K_1458-t1 [Saitoella complicata NRRL Y-17804]|uniref:Uncharacterized protein n=1 Tax=Saitoella complicata (strain BCRC 22490 / CBS 7301 / JCM 7358 / NBRC 10748 / NRRL Y-17804) TaxID=698492 RepID=A0A0E9NBR7_SAICN|nr:hypothetical protein G7K_1458-t1 [Saitoella complicata NRRL Y-17804]
MSGLIVESFSVPSPLGYRVRLCHFKYPATKSSLVQFRIRTVLDLPVYVSSFTCSPVISSELQSILSNKTVPAFEVHMIKIHPISIQVPPNWP